MSETEELRGGQSQQEPLPVLPAPEVHGAGDVSRWWVDTLSVECFQDKVSEICLALAEAEYYLDILTYVGQQTV